MNENRTNRKKSNTKSFYTALCICVAMVGFACYFAYAQTADRLSNQLDTISRSEINIHNSSEDDKYDKVIGLQTDIPKNNQPVSTEQPSAETDMIQTAPETTPIQTDIQTAASVPQEKIHSSFIFPIDSGSVVNPFSNGELVKSATTGAWQTHNGIDISGDIGTEVKAIYSGTVTEVTNEALWGICVTIDHGNGITARYCGLSQDVSVEAGSEVKGGTVIGTIGNTCEIECEDEPHMHFEIIRNGGYSNPIDVINGVF